MIDVLWNAGLGCALLGLVGMAFGAAPAALRIAGWVGLALSVLAGALALRLRKFSLGVVLAFGACVFTLLVVKSPSPTQTASALVPRTSSVKRSAPQPRPVASSSRPGTDRA